MRTASKKSGRDLPSEQAILDCQQEVKPSPSAALAEVARRVPIRWVTKMLGTMLGISLFFLGYFLVLEYPLFPATVMPYTALDRLIPFEPRALPLYLSLWFYVSLPPALLSTTREMISFVLAIIALSVIGLGVFALWPTLVIPPSIPWEEYSSFTSLKQVDAGGNACPSLHVAFAFFSGIWLEKVIQEISPRSPARWLNFLWCAGIIYSTLAVKQHVVLDVLAGLLLGGAVAYAQLAYLKKAARSGNSR